MYQTETCGYQKYYSLCRPWLIKSIMFIGWSEKSNFDQMMSEMRKYEISALVQSYELVLLIFLFTLWVHDVLEKAPHDYHRAN